MSTVIPDDIRRFLEHCPVGVLGTTKADGSLRLATVVFVLDGDCVLVSSEFTTGKVRDISHTGRAALCVYGLEPPHPSISLAGPARLLTEGIGAASTLVWEKIQGERVPERFEDADVTAFGRTVIALSVETVAGRAHL
jgi:hypothetical protein